VPCRTPHPKYAESVEALREVNDRMHRAMSLAPSEDVDRDFAAGMLAHHEGAVEMAQVELRYGRDPELRRLAEEIRCAGEGDRDDAGLAGPSPVSCKQRMLVR
jgi:uncharacterized protein (DUF305 family)